MDQPQPKPPLPGERTIAIHLSITPASLILALLLTGLLLLLATMIGASATTTAAVPVVTAPIPTQIVSAAYPLPAPAQPQATPSITSVPSVTSTAPAPASATVVPPTQTAILEGIVGLEEAPLPVFKPASVVFTPQPTPTLPDLMIDFDPAPPLNPPTSAPAPSRPPAPTATPRAAESVVPIAARDAPPTTVPPPPGAFLTGDQTWTTSVEITRTLTIVEHASLTIKPGVDVRLGDGVSIIVTNTAQLKAEGTPQQPVRFLGNGTAVRWDGLYGMPGSVISLQSTQIRQGGSGGTLITSDGGQLILKDVSIAESFGQVRVTDSLVRMNGVEMKGNRIPYGAALQATYTYNNPFYNEDAFTLLNSRIIGNMLNPGAATVQIRGDAAIDSIRLNLQGNRLGSAEGPVLELIANTLLQGSLVCNSLVGGSIGLSLYNDAPVPVKHYPDLNIGANVIEGQTPLILPIYVEHGIGRGATSTLPLAMGNNWWNNPLGPYMPDSNADGRGSAVGPNITFTPWLTARPVCAPRT